MAVYDVGSPEWQETLKLSSPRAPLAPEVAIALGDPLHNELIPATIPAGSAEYRVRMLALADALRGAVAMPVPEIPDPICPVTDEPEPKKKKRKMKMPFSK